MVGHGMRLKALFLGLLVQLLFSGKLSPRAAGHKGFFDAHIAMVPKAEGDSTPLGQRLLCVLPAVYRLWTSVRLSPCSGLVQFLGA